MPHAAVCERDLFVSATYPPIESWGEQYRQNGFQNMRVVGDTELIWNR